MQVRRTLFVRYMLGIWLPMALASCNGVVSEHLEIGQSPTAGQTVEGPADTRSGTGQTSAPPMPGATQTPAPRPSVTPTPTLEPIKSSISNPNAILSAASGFAMDLSEGTLVNGTPIIQYAFHGGTNQIWQLITMPGNSTYLLQSAYSVKCVDIAGSSASAGAGAVLWDCTGSASQQWTDHANADGTHTLVNRNSGLCLDVPNDGSASAIALDQATCNGSPQQRWNLTVPYARAGNGFALFIVDPNNAVTSLTMTMPVPPEPASTGTLFLWPGLQPGGVNYDPIDNGVLQPVLTWGLSCAPTPQPSSYSTWWISGQYVNSYGQMPGYSGCYTGSAMPVNVGDTLNISMTLANTTWTQTILDVQTNTQVTYSIDMEGQAQSNIEFAIEEYSSVPVSDVIFNDIVFTMAQPQMSACAAVKAGANDYVAAGIPSADQKSCAVSKIILRAQGVAATTPNP